MATETMQRSDKLNFNTIAGLLWNSILDNNPCIRKGCRILICAFKEAVNRIKKQVKENVKNKFICPMMV